MASKFCRQQPSVEIEESEDRKGTDPGTSPDLEPEVDVWDLDAGVTYQSQYEDVFSFSPVPDSGLFGYSSPLPIGPTHVGLFDDEAPQLEPSEPPDSETPYVRYYSRSTINSAAKITEQWSKSIKPFTRASPELIPITDTESDLTRSTLITGLAKPKTGNSQKLVSPNSAPLKQTTSYKLRREQEEEAQRSSSRGLGSKSGPFSLFGCYTKPTNRDTLRLVPIAEANSISQFAFSRRKIHFTSTQGKPSKEEQFDRQQNADIALDWLTALYENDIDAVRYLLQNGPRPNFLLVFGDPLDREWLVSLHVAARKSLEITQLLLNNGADVDIKYAFSGTTLQHVVLHGRSDLKYSVARLLIQSGSDVNAEAGVGGTALIAAITTKDLELTRLLLSNKADPNQTGGNNYPHSPLHFAVRDGHSEIAATLIEYGANIDMLDASWGSPLICAAANGREETARLLLARGADSSRAEEELQQWPQARTPDYLKIWQMAANGDTFPTFRDMMENLLDENFDSDELTLFLDWEVPEVISRSRTLQDSQPINFNEDVLFLATFPIPSASSVSGSPNVEASSLSEYLFSMQKEDVDVDFIYTIIELLKEAEFGDPESGFSLLLQSTSRISVTCFEYRVSIHLWKGAELSIISPLIQSLELLCKAIRIPPESYGLTLSKTNFRFFRRTVSTPGPEERPRYALGISANLEYELLPNLEHNCWQALLDSCVVLDCGREPRPQPSFGRGIKLGFDLMATLAAVEFSMAIDGGVIFVGYQTALIPIGVENGCAQFHLITASEGQIDPYQCVQQIETRLLIDDPLEFKGMTCFLGWCEVAQINLGTKALLAKVGHSNGKSKEKSIELNGFTIAATSSAPSNIASVQIQTNYTFRTHRVHFEPSVIYKKLLVDTSNQIALIYDSMQKRSWIVPKLSLLLHMAQTYIFSIPGISDETLPFVEPYSDAYEIVDAVFSMGGMNYGDTDQPFLLRNLIVGLNLNLLATTRNIRKSGGNILNGFEFLDVIHEPDRGACMKGHKLHRRRNWTDLVNLVDSVVVCSKFGDAITPSTQTGNRLCSRCNSLPPGLDYLATTAGCLNRLLKQEGETIPNGSLGNISDGVIWNMKGDPFQRCSHKNDSKLTCWERPDIFQKLKGNRWYQKPNPQNTATPTVQSPLPSTAGIVFI